jgi:6-phosphogluconolactonase
MSFITLSSLTGYSQDIRLVTGSIAKNGVDGINIFDFNARKGTLTRVAGYNAGQNPSYFCISGKNKLIYAINEVSVFNGIKGGGLTTLKYAGNFEKIEKVNEVPVPNGGPCFISLTPDNGFLLIANYGGGSVAVVKLDKDGIPEEVCDTVIYNGKAGKISHAHMILSDPGGKRIYVTDLGLDRIMIYTLNKTSGRLVPFNETGISLPVRTGPRHFVFNESGTKMYVIGELNSTVTVFDVSDKEGLIHLQTVSTLSANFKDQNSSADIHIDKSGKFLYGSNRGENSIVTYKIGKDGLLNLAGHSTCGGNWPRNFTADPTGKYLLIGNQKSGGISVLAIDKKSGLPGKSVFQVDLLAPACLKFNNQ